MDNPKFVGQFDGLDIYHDTSESENRIVLQCSFGRGYISDYATIYIDASRFLSLMIAYVAGMPLPDIAPYEARLCKADSVVDVIDSEYSYVIRISIPSFVGYWLQKSTAQTLITYLRKENVL